ncbi:MAG: hypothetical protein S4CHLAM123_15640 [Chlamydiales bacterium]|nr:hypothetical protein [Chlamydiales bacterium]
MFRNLFIVTEFEFRALLSDRPGMLRIVIEPLAYLFLLAQGLSSSFSKLDGMEFNYLSFVFPGIIALQLFRVFMHSIYRLTIDRRWGLQALKISSGTSIFAYTIGMSAVPVVLFIFQTLIAYPLSLSLGTILTFQGLLFLLAVGVVSALFWAFLAICVTFYFKKYSQRDLFLGFLLLPLSLSAPVFYSLENVPFYLKAISRVNPLSYQVIALREAFLYHQLSSSFIIIASLTVVFFLISRVMMKKAEYLPSQI